MPKIIPGQEFDSLADFKDAIRAWAIEEGFTPAILDSDARRVRVGCRTASNCPFRIRCNYENSTGLARVSTLVEKHTCKDPGAHSNGKDPTAPANEKVLRGEVTKLRFLLDAVPKLMLIDQETNTRDIIEKVKNRYGQVISIRQAQKVKSQLLAIAAEEMGSHLWDKMKEQLGDSAMEEDMRRGKKVKLDHVRDMRDASFESADYEDDEAEDRTFQTEEPDFGHEPRHDEMIDRVERLETDIEQALGQAPSKLTAVELRAEAAALFATASEKFREATQLHMQASKLFTQATELEE